MCLHGCFPNGSSEDETLPGARVTVGSTDGTLAYRKTLFIDLGRSVYVASAEMRKKPGAEREILKPS